MHTGRLIYTGVGSRETPVEICQGVITPLARTLSAYGWVLRSGDADGSDKAFQAGSPDHMTESYVTRKMKEYRKDAIIGEASPKWVDALRMAKDIHPNWHAMSSWGRAQHGRDVLQVLGGSLNEPSRFLVCWGIPKPGGSISGGTRTAWECARKIGIPVFNLNCGDPVALAAAIVEEFCL